MARPLKALGEVLNNLFKKPATSQYPVKKHTPAERYRARIKFTPEECIGCNICMRNCPANAITIKQINLEAKPQTLPDGKVVPAKRKFKCVIDLSRCIYCAQCVDGCPKKALKSTDEFELAAFDKKALQDEFKHPDETAK
ncbi:MAG: 4Fe-4S binding protein [Elusimicrobium sp.]|jgi:formate hydrogenlyase subunit 6/NADH:ubiquinone oxidoreductase subunit I|nr:4Fe-4S binding protein [Elusimicrobium sp.]